MKIFYTASDFAAELSRDGRLLGIDLGEKTIGLALSDTGHVIATGLETLKRGKFNCDAKQLKMRIDEHKVVGIVLGYPVQLDGKPGPRCQSIAQFARNLHKDIDLPFLLWDERLSTLAVNRMLLQGDLSRARRAELVDKLAASYILQGALDALGSIADQPS